MINLFRKIKRHLLNEGKIIQFLLNTVAEIVLVVVGILIALYIDDWAQQKENLEREQEILNAMHTEFSQNLTEMDRALITLDECDQATRNLLAQFKLGKPTMDKSELDILIYRSQLYEPFAPSRNVLAEVIANGDLKLITNDTLKRYLFKWDTQLVNNESTLRTHQLWINDRLIMYLVKETSLRNIDHSFDSKWITASELFKTDYHRILNDRFFENILENHLYNIENLKKDYINTQKLMLILDKITIQNEDSQ